MYFNKKDFSDADLMEIEEDLDVLVEINDDEGSVNKKNPKSRAHKN